MTAPPITFADLVFQVVADDILDNAPAPPVIYLPAPVVYTLESRAQKQTRELKRFLSDLDQALATRAGVPFEVSLIPRMGQFAVRTRDGIHSRNVLIMTVDIHGLTFAPAPQRNQQTRLQQPVAWLTRYACQPQQTDFLTLLNQRIARHNAKGGHFTN